MENNIYVLKNFISNDLLPSTLNAEINDSDNLFEFGLDSLRMMRLSSYIEKLFSISIDDKDIIPENFETISSIVTFIQKYT